MSDFGLQEAYEDARRGAAHLAIALAVIIPVKGLEIGVERTIPYLKPLAAKFFSPPTANAAVAQPPPATISRHP